MTVHTIKITRPDPQEDELMWKLYHAADDAQNRWGGGWSVKDITAELQRTDLDREQRRFFMRAWQVLVIENGGFGRFMSAFNTYVHNMQDPDDECVAWKPELKKVFNDAAILPELLEAYSESKTEIAKRDGLIETLKDLNESRKADYDKLAAECAAMRADYINTPTLKRMGIPVGAAIDAAIASIGANALRDFASVLNAKDEHEGRVHFALIARADQLEGKIEDEPGLRGVKP